MVTTTKIRVMLADDHEIVRVGFKRLLETTDDIEVIAEVSTGEEAYRLVKELSPDVTIMDINMPGIGGLEAINRICKRNGQAKVIALTVHEAEPFPTRILGAGAKTYLSKRCAPRELIHAVRMIHKGGTFITAREIKLMDKIPSTQDIALSCLTAREFQVFWLLAEGRAPMEISKDINLNHKTIHSHRASIMKKLKLETHASIIRFATLQGIIDE